MKRISVISLAMLVLLGCSALAQDVRYNFDKTADFSKFKTYKVGHTERRGTTRCHHRKKYTSSGGSTIGW